MNAWTYDTLKRARIVGQRTYERAGRKVEWPSVQLNAQPRPVPKQKESCTHVTLDEAFSTVVHLMAEASRQCKQYHRCNPPRESQEVEQRHCKRFHPGDKHCSCVKPQTSLHEETHRMWIH